MAESLNALLQASVWLAITVVLLAALRPLLLALGGAALVYRSWWCVPVLLGALHLPLPMGPMVDALPVLAAAVAWTAPVVVPAAPTWPWLLLLAWALGALGMGGASWRAQRRFERAMGTLRPRADGTWQASADPGLPALVGLWAPRIVVGPAFEADFSPAEQDLILQHERSHRRHGDPWANAVLALLRCVFWFHPLLPWAARRFLRDQELACDARTVDPHPALRRLYANALLKAQLVHPVAPMACHWRSQPMLKERIAMLKEHKRKALPWMTGQVLVMGLFVGMGTVAWASQGGAGAGPSITAEPAAATKAAKGDVDAQTRDMGPPTYPKAALDQGISGKVVLRVEVDATGAVGDVSVLSSTPAGVFDEASIAAAKRWTFEPARRNGTAVASALKIPMTYEMNEKAPTQ
ncbi:MAG: M56 family metallopeptidase [Stenotrophomonas rhizophila]|uniref:M56 family metallopeptidase n=1 Tax=Stenotrophomonas rhizophila TaxID=216778 RepID=UPI003D0F1F8B